MLPSDELRARDDPMEDYRYQGEELDVFEHAVRWKDYFRSQFRQHLTGRVLEVGGGIGATTRFLCDGRQTQWTALEPDAALAQTMRARFAERPLPIDAEVVEKTVSRLDPESRFDAILYIDVLEHIEDDCLELRQAAGHLAPGGHLVVLAPAHQFLYSEFDQAVGHVRRYSRDALSKAAPSDLEERTLVYLDSVGMLASLGNRLLLRASRPTLRDIRFWDSVLVRLSRFVDPILGYRVGKSVLGVWRKPQGPGQPGPAQSGSESRTMRPPRSVLTGLTRARMWPCF